MDPERDGVDPIPETAMCRLINKSCTQDPSCPASRAGQPCWVVEDTSCCERNDKTRCCYCSVFLAFLDDASAASLLQVEMRSEEDAGFTEFGKRMHAYIQAHGTVELKPYWEEANEAPGAGPEAG